MNNCPECGNKVEQDDAADHDFGATIHRTFSCTGPECKKSWEVSYRRGVEEELLAIMPAMSDEEEARQ